jgi:uncharacterized membrane protein
MDTLRTRLGTGERRTRRYTVAAQPLTWALAASAVSVATFVAWTSTGSAGDASYMELNLVLAWIPVVMSYAIAVAARVHVPAVALLVLGALWLLFLPNAPYLLTDVVHVHNFRNPSPGLIAGGLGALAMTGIVLYFASVATVQKAAALRLGPRAARWIPPVCALTAGLGIYCGRFLRWNSWDVIANPLGLVRYATRHPHDPATVSTAIGFALCCALILEVAYALLSRWGAPDSD